MASRMILNSSTFPWFSSTIWLIAGIILAVFTWRFTRRVTNPWGRMFLRATVVALIFTPVRIYNPGYIGEFVVPAWYAWYVAIHESNWFIAFQTVMPLAWTTWILWVLGMVLYWVRRTRAI